MYLAIDMKLNDSLVEINLIPFERNSISGCRLSTYVKKQLIYNQNGDESG